jgi:type IV pilus assembly protein PilO
MALLPQRQRDQVLLLVCVASLAALGLYYNYVWTKKHEELNGVQARVELLETTNERAKRDMARGSLTRLKHESDRLRAELDLMRQLVPTSNEVPLLLDQISTAARQAGLDVFDVRPDSAIVGEHFDVHRYHMAVSGDYHSISAFLANVGSLTRIVAPQNLELVVSNKKPERALPPQMQRLEAKFDVQTYVAHAGQSVDGLATSAVGMSVDRGGRP